MNKARIIFMGTPDFAVASLQALLEAGMNVVAVVTAPDKPAGRGKKIKASAVKHFALEHHLKLLQPSNLKNTAFIEEIKSLHPDIQVVVAFRMLPKAVWGIPRLGTFNLHASLLPQYRGAAPINWAIINGEKETGVSTFLIDEKIDTGQILFQEKEPILPEDTAGSLHDRLMAKGARLVVKTVIALQNKTISPRRQIVEDDRILRPAPKIFKNDCRIDWHKTAGEIYNFIRGLSPYPAAFTYLIDPKGKPFLCKIYEASLEMKQKNEVHDFEKNKLIVEGSSVKVELKDGFIVIKTLQLEGRKRMPVGDFLRGSNNLLNWNIGFE